MSTNLTECGLLPSGILEIRSFFVQGTDLELNLSIIIINQQKQFLFASEIKAILQIISSAPDNQTLFDSFANGYSDHNERTFFEDIKQLRGGHNLVLRNSNLSIYRYYEIENQPCRDSFEQAKEKLRELLICCS